MDNEVGERFAQALAKKDRPGLLEVLDPDIDFRGMTPGRFWETTSAQALVDDIIFGAWFDAADHIDSLDDVQLGTVVDRKRVAYRLQVTNPDGIYLVEQQAYFGLSDNQIYWLRIMCSGFRAIGDERPDI